MKCDNGRSQFREKEDVGTLSVSCEHCQEVLGVLLFFLRKVTTAQTCVANHMWLVRPESLHRVNMFLKNGNILALQPTCGGCTPLIALW